jgi:prepilin-type processing-associated H-X9-DG protein
VQKVREAAARVQCQNNLKQMALALHSYHDVNKTFPWGHQDSTFLSLPWAVYILPYMEQDNLYRLFDTTKNFYDPANQGPQAQTRVPVYCCPSSPSNGRVFTDTWTAPNEFPSNLSNLSWAVSASDYVSTAGVQWRYMAKWYPSYPGSGDGVMQDDRPMSITQITDGTSNTLLVGENGGGPDLYARGKLIATAPNFPPGLGVEGHAWADTMNGEVWSGNGFDFATGLDSSSQPAVGNPNTCILNCNNTGANHGSWYSFHPGVVNFAFADGSVHAIAETTSGKVVMELVTAASGVVVPGDF